MARKDQEWKDDKVFQSKTDNGKQYIADGKSWLDYYYDDQKKRKKEAEKGQVRYTEAAKASRVQYSVPGYQGKSQSQGKTYQWERDLMADTKIKGAGNSYTKKFDALTKSMGMTEGQAGEFRKYLDFQEDSQHVDPKKNKDGSLRENQSLKYARDAHLEVDVVDGILKNMQKTAAAKIKKAKEVPFKKVSGWDKVKNALGVDLSEEKQNTLLAKQLGVEPHYGGKKDKTQPVTKEQWADLQATKAREDEEKNANYDDRKGLLGLLDRFVLPISQAADEVLIPGNNDRQIQNEIDKYGDVVNPATKAGLRDRGLETKILHGAGTMAGYLAPYGEGYAAVNAALNLPKMAKAAQFIENSPYVGRAIRGGAAGVTAESGLAATNELANSEAGDMEDYAKRIALGAAGGAIGDPLLYGAGQAIKGGLGRFAKVEGEMPTYSGNVSDNVLDALAPNTAKTVKSSDSLYDQLLGQNSKPAPQTKTEAWNNFTPDEIPAVEEPTSLLDELLFGQRGNGPKARGAVNQVEMPRYAKDNISDMGTNILNRTDQLNNAPEGGYNQRLLDIQKEMKANKNLTVDQARAFDEAQKVLDQRKAYEDAHVEQELAPYAPSQQQAAEAQMKWENVVKQSQEEAARIKGEFGKIHVPKGAAEDYPIPPQFRAAYGDKATDDIFSFADQMGFSSADEAVQYLQKLDQDSKIKLKDMMPDRNSMVSPSQWDALEQAARRNFEQSDAGKSIDTLLEDLLAAGRSTDDIEALYQAHKGPNDPATFDEMIKLAELEHNAKPVERNLKAMLRDDPRVAEQVKALNALGGTKAPQEPGLNGNYGQGNLQGIDDVLALLGENSKNVNNSQAPEQVLEQLARPEGGKKLTVEELNALIRGEKPKKAEAEAVNPAPVSEEVAAGQEISKENEMLLRLNGQRFNDGNAPDNSMFSYTKNEPDQVSDHMTGFEKAREGLVNSLQKFQVVSNKLMKQNAPEIKDSYKARIESAKQAGRPEEAKRLTKEIKYLFKDESSLLKAAQNEETSYMITDDLIKSTYGEAEKALQKAKISVADAWEYQAAKNLDWFMKKGGHADYQLPKGWDKGRLVDVINQWKGNTVMDQFSESLNTIRKTRLDYLQKYGLKSTEEFDALSKNPHYIPMMKDFDWKKSSIESAMRVSGDIGKSNPNVMALGKGGEEFFKNPIESLVGATYTSIRNSLRNGTHAEIAKLAQLDKDGVFIRPTDLKATHDGHVIEHYDNGVVQNYVISNDLADVIKELRSPEKAAGIAEKITGFMGSLKTTSIPYQARAIPRDWTQFIVNSDGNPISHMYNMMAMLKSPKKSMQQAMKEGGAFHNAFKDGMGAHRTTHEMAQNFVKENRLKGGKDEIVTPTTAKEKTKKVIQTLWKANIDYGVGEKLGNFGDTAPRLAAIKQVEKEFMPAIQELEGKIASATDDFTKDTLSSELNDLKTQFQREKIFKSRDVINYSRHGSSKYAKFFKQYWNFANTATQSVDRYFRQVRKKPIATLSKTLAIAAPMMGAQEVAYRMSSDQDKKIYDDSPDFLKNTMYMFVVDGHRIMFPKPFEVAFVTSPLEGAINLTHTYDEESAKKKVTDGVVNSMRELVPLDIGDLLTLNFSAPSIAQPVMEVANNRKNFNGKPISYYDRFKSSDTKTHFFLEDGAKMEDVASKFTSPTAKALGEVINANPDYIAHLIGGYGGDTGKNALAALDALVKPSTNRNKTVTQNMNPLQDFYNSQKPTYFWRDTYTEKDKNKDK